MADTQNYEVTLMQLQTSLRHRNKGDKILRINKCADVTHSFFGDEL